MNRRQALKTVALGAAALSAPISLMPSPSIELLPHQKYALKLYEKFDKVLVVWPAGYGKTFMVNHILSNRSGYSPLPEGYNTTCCFDINRKEIISVSLNAESIEKDVILFKKVMLFSNAITPNIVSHKFDCIFTAGWHKDPDYENLDLWTVYIYKEEKISTITQGAYKNFIQA